MGLSKRAVIKEKGETRRAANFSIEAHAEEEGNTDGIRNLGREGALPWGGERHGAIVSPRERIAEDCASSEKIEKETPAGGKIPLKVRSSLVGRELRTHEQVC